MELSDGNMDNFVGVLQSNGLSRAVKALVDGDEAEPLMFKSPNVVLPSNQDVSIREYLLNRQLKLCRNANRFTPATLNTRYQVDIAHMFTDLEVLKENKKKQGSKQTTLDEVLGIIKSSPSCKVLIDGEGGIGKTTLLRYLAYNWATKESDETFKGKLVFPVNIRDMEEGKDILDVIVKQMKLKDFNLKTNLPNDPSLIKRFIMNHDDEIVLLLDGLDELRVRNESPISLFRKEELENSTVILTSRSENIDEYIKESSVHLKVKGFNEHNINRYIKKYFEYVEVPALGDSLITELSGSMRRPTWRNTHNEEYSMCKNPMLLLSICIMWEDKQHLPADKTDLFKEIYPSILNQFIEKQEPKDKKNL
ncbi:nucleotide-binding oligomerization domain-containing protein 2-like [Anneissia japonica]|uniref:nucleotide-binding oligomerization domain-containing protein 2-like n=1 Tax=Anneissia japonica TaxID=1529436 RepID=UPI001425A9FF|nr:nucleotide-binding oligomerization domain-containing protein 2-like [Anneissia japonica]